MARWVLLFPGQGSQRLGMGKSFHDTFNASRHVFHQADHSLKYHLSRLMFNEDTGLKKKGERLADVMMEETRTEEEKRLLLSKTEHAQPAILTYSTAVLSAMKSELDTDLSQHTVGFLGHSLGEFSAAVAAGSMAFSDSVPLVHRRGRWMQQASDEFLSRKTDGEEKDDPVMAAFYPLTFEHARKLCDAVERTSGCLEIVCQPANVNGPNQVVLSGSRRGLALAEALSKGKTVVEHLSIPRVRKITYLQVSAPFHSSIMSPVKSKLERCLSRDLQLRQPEKPIVSICDTSLMTTGDELSRGLVNQTDLPVLYYQGIQCCLLNPTLRPTLFIEVGGSVLAPLARRIISEMKVQAGKEAANERRTVSASTDLSLEDLAAYLEQVDTLSVDSLDDLKHLCDLAS